MEETESADSENLGGYVVPQVVIIEEVMHSKRPSTAKDRQEMDDERMSESIIGSVAWSGTNPSQSKVTDLNNEIEQVVVATAEPGEWDSKNARCSQLTILPTHLSILSSRNLAKNMKSGLE